MGSLEHEFWVPGNPVWFCPARGKHARYNGAFRTMAGSGTIPINELVASNFIIDASAKYIINEKFGLTANVINLFDVTYVASRVPAGLRPGHPFGIYGGFQYRF